MLVAWVLVAGALASGTATPKPPAPPPVDLTVLPPSARVQPPQAGATPHPVVAHILADRSVVAPGDHLRIGVYLVQQPDWHTYWVSPGDIGKPTTVAWTLPDGFAAGPLRFAVPQRFETENIVSFGYEDQILAFSDVTVPADAKPGPFTVDAHAEWLVCQSQCIPGRADLALPLTVDAAAGTPSAFGPLFDHFEAQVPAEKIDGVKVTVTPTPAVLVPEKPFEVAITVAPEAGHTLGALPPGGVLWPTYTPIASDEVILDGTTLEPSPGGGFVVHVKAETYLADPRPTASSIGGLFQVDLDGHPVRFQLSSAIPWEPAPATASVPPVAAKNPPIGVAPTEGPPAAPAVDAASFPMMLGLAFLGGLLLNIMPCVLPVLTLKLYSLVEESHHGPRERHKAGMAYGAGVLVSFLVLAGVVWGLRQVGGEKVAWGFQFQSPLYVAGLATIVFAFGLSLFGVFEVPVIGANAAAEKGDMGGAVGHFFTGVFAALLGTPCSAPFLAPAVGYAFSQPNILTVVLFFEAIGLGLALPFMIVAFIPQLFAFLPQPGAWMDTFKKLMGFTLMATTVWLVSVLGGQIGSDGEDGFLWFLAAVGLGCFGFGHWGSVAESTGRQVRAALGGLAVMALGAWWSVDLTPLPPDAVCTGDVHADGLDFSDSIPWQPFSEQALADTSGHLVFVDFTAKWCVTCKVTEKTVIETSSVRDAMRERGVVPLRADWTRADPVITKWLERYGRAGVPFWLVIPADRTRDPIPLADAITPGTLISALDQGT